MVPGGQYVWVGRGRQRVLAGHKIVQSLVRAGEGKVKEHELGGMCLNPDSFITSLPPVASSFNPLSLTILIFRMGKRRGLQKDEVEYFISNLKQYLAGSGHSINGNNLSLFSLMNIPKL